ncbi:MAG TPA: hypothetical protein VMF13_14710 [Luteitalea sp.]|nr:hypothetical protein [Luteitalea sp.]
MPSTFEIPPFVVRRSSFVVPLLFRRRGRVVHVAQRRTIAAAVTHAVL